MRFQILGISPGGWNRPLRPFPTFPSLFPFYLFCLPKAKREKKKPRWTLIMPINQLIGWNNDKNPLWGRCGRVWTSPRAGLRGQIILTETFTPPSHPSLSPSQGRSSFPPWRGEADFWKGVSLFCSDSDEKPLKGSLRSLNGDIKATGSADSLVDYGEGEHGMFNEDGSFIGAYSGSKEKGSVESTGSSTATFPLHA